MNTFRLAAALERGACPHCSTPRQIYFHYDDSAATCPAVREPRRLVLVGKS